MADFCLQCGGPLRHGKKYCSYSCRNLGRWGKDKEIYHCNECGSPFSRTLTGSFGKTFCSQKCRGKSLQKPAPFTCTKCGVVTVTIPSQAKKRRVCSTCAVVNPKVIVGVSTGYRFGNKPKRVGISQGFYTGTCEICGFSRFTEFAHIVAIRQGGSAEPWNILTLCPNHHRLFDCGALVAEELAAIEPRVLMALDKLSVSGVDSWAVETPSRKGRKPLLELLVGA